MTARAEDRIVVKNRELESRVREVKSAEAEKQAMIAAFEEEKETMRSAFDLEKANMDARRESELEAARENMAEIRANAVRNAQELRRSLEEEAQQLKRSHEEEREMTRRAHEAEVAAMREAMAAEMDVAQRRLVESEAARDAERESALKERRIHAEQNDALRKRLGQLQQSVWQEKSRLAELKAQFLRELEQTQSQMVVAVTELNRRVEAQEQSKATLEEKLRLANERIGRKCQQVQGLLHSQESLKQLLPKVEMSEKVLKEKTELENDLFRERMQATRLESEREAERREAASTRKALDEEVTALRGKNAALEADIVAARREEDRWKRAVEKRQEEEACVAELRCDMRACASVCMFLRGLCSAVCVLLSVTFYFHLFPISLNP